MIVVPATFSTINKWAAGISDTLALGLINEAIGMSIPIVAVPHVNAPLARHPALAASFATLRGAGVTVLDLGRHPEPEAFPWDQVLGRPGLAARSSGMFPKYRPAVPIHTKLHAAYA